MEHLIGVIALNITFAVYLVLYLPQVSYNLKRRSVDGLSFLMHTLLLIGYSADMMYGFGRHMQWQYRAISVVGFIVLMMQHFQFGYFKKITRTYIIITIALVLWLAFVVLSIIKFQLPVNAYIRAGMLAWLVGIIYLMPQLWKNYCFSSAAGVSLTFIYLELITTSCDSIAAWCLHWDYPSRFGSPIEFILGAFLLIQCYFYQKQSKLQQVIKSS